MQKANKIAAFFFLGLFSLMILHQAFPHLHHQHADSHSHTNIAHSSEHHHHDDSSQEEKEEDSPYGLLGFVMDMHIHSTVASDLVLLERNTIEKQTIVDKDVAKSTVDIKGVFSIKYRQNSKPSVYHPPNKYFNSYLSSLDSRGPPSLG
ncbi:hypothetical protein [Maribacter arcticus]|uniref:Uncharacterized protein n=1 Tax=Maribacter arcticus TaxID=561365 RepID=A0A1T5DS69_9FLAO|nr:hypothetical protein [Maribacter arcticus]SKB74504.1 hypothetical protein SAMN05660866_03070 [Maribacter arcticus]